MSIGAEMPSYRINQSNVIVFIWAYHYQPHDNDFDWVIFISVGTKLSVPYYVHWADTTFAGEKVIFRVSAGLKFTSDILSKQPLYCTDKIQEASFKVGIQF